MPKSVDTIDLSNTASAYYAPATIAPAGRLIHVAGQPGSTKDGGVPADYESQIHLALLNLRKLIITAGSSIENIVKLNLFIVDYDAANRKHTRHIQRFLAGHRPAITLVPVPKLAVPSWLFEIDAVITLPESSVPPVLPTVNETTDVIIVGAGLAGLSAAHDVLRAGLSCVVLEARDRVGGKTWTTPLQDGKGVIDLGAAWINDTNQSKIYALAQRYGVELIEQNTQGNAVLEDADGSCSPFAYGELPNFDRATQAHLALIRDMCEADCQALDTWRPKDTGLDSLTFEAYLRSRGASEAALATATVWTRAMLGQDPKDISALYFLNYCKSGGGLLQMRSDRKHGGQYLRVRQGTQAFSLGLASSLPEATVRLSSPVQSVIQTVDRAVKVQAGGAVYAGRKVIITVPTPVMKTISFHPKLPPAKQAWIESTTYGYYTKAMMEFRSPFWVKAGFCGLAQSFTGPASVVRDSCSPEDRKYVLTCFMAGDPGRAWAALPTKEREQCLLQQLTKLFGVSNVETEFVQMTTYEWVNDEWAGWGCPCTALTPGVLDTLGPDALRENSGNLHFAGTETAGEWKGYMEGAVRSGERAAAEVVKSLNAGIISLLRKFLLAEAIVLVFAIDEILEHVAGELKCATQEELIALVDLRTARSTSQSPLQKRAAEICQGFLTDDEGGAGEEVLRQMVLFCGRDNPRKFTGLRDYLDYRYEDLACEFIWAAAKFSIGSRVDQHNPRMKRFLELLGDQFTACNDVFSYDRERKDLMDAKSSVLTNIAAHIEDIYGIQPDHAKSVAYAFQLSVESELAKEIDKLHAQGLRLDEWRFLNACLHVASGSVFTSVVIPRYGGKQAKI